jgi:hypothetical protein
MVTDSKARSQRSLLNFLSRSKKKRTISIDSTVPSVTESLDSTTGTSSTGELRQLRQITSSPAFSSQQGIYCRAANYIRRRNAPSASASSNRAMDVIEDDGSSCDSARPPERVDDRFCKTLNKCEPSQIEQLRQNRAEVAPIVCYESDNSDDVVKEDQDAEMSLALKSRLEALDVQQRLLGKGHPDVVFMQQQLRRLQRRGRFESKSGPRSPSTPFYYNPHAMQ